MIRRQSRVRELPPEQRREGQCEQHHQCDHSVLEACGTLRGFECGSAQCVFAGERAIQFVAPLGIELHTQPRRMLVALRLEELTLPAHVPLQRGKGLRPASALPIRGCEILVDALEEPRVLHLLVVGTRGFEIANGLRRAAQFHERRTTRLMRCGDRISVVHAAVVTHRFLEPRQRLGRAAAARQRRPDLALRECGISRLPGVGEDRRGLPEMVERCGDVPLLAVRPAEIEERVGDVGRLVQSLIRDQQLPVVLDRAVELRDLRVRVDVGDDGEGREPRLLLAELRMDLVRGLEVGERIGSRAADVPEVAGVRARSSLCLRIAAATREFRRLDEIALSLDRPRVIHERFAATDEQPGAHGQVVGASGGHESAPGRGMRESRLLGNIALEHLRPGDQRGITEPRELVADGRENLAGSRLVALLQPPGFLDRVGDPLRRLTGRRERQRDHQRQHTHTDSALQHRSLIPARRLDISRIGR